MTLLLTMVVLTGCGNDRHAEVAERGRQVMPFDLDRTTHRFTKTDTGGVQTVSADDPNDIEQRRLIREHLRNEVDRFAAGDFTDPARLHGDTMPGLDTLRGHAGRIAITYQDTDAGAAITYRTDDAELIEALHVWFDAQVSDHGKHAEHG
jgi:hypothetical protein